MGSGKIIYHVQSCPACNKQLLKVQVGTTLIGSPLITCKKCGKTYHTELRTEWYQYQNKWVVFIWPILLPIVFLLVGLFMQDMAVGVFGALFLALPIGLFMSGRETIRIIQSKKRMRNQSYLSQLLQMRIISVDEYRELVSKASKGNDKDIEQESFASKGCGENMTWQLEGNTLYIDGTGEIKISHKKNVSIRKIEQVVISDSVTEIGKFAFKDCIGLTSITIPDSVTEIGGEAFWGCTSLTSITIPDGVAEIRERVFQGCTSLTSITIPDSVTEIGEFAFKDCTALTSITIPDSVTKIDRIAFVGCTGLTSITIPDSVTEIGWGAFKGCTNLTSITIPDNVTKIGEDAFENIPNIIYHGPAQSDDNLGALSRN